MVKGNKELDWESILVEFDSGEYGNEGIEDVLKDYVGLEDLGDIEGFDVELTQDEIDELGEVYDDFEKDREDEEDYVFGTIEDELV